MGNSPPTGGLRLPNTDCSYVVNVGQSVTIQFRGKDVQKRNEGERTDESWAMSYNSGKRQCLFILSNTFRNTTTITTSPSSNTNLDIIIIQDSLAPLSNRFSFAMTLQKDEPGLLFFKESCDWVYTPGGHHHRYKTNKFINDTTNAHGEITSTAFDIYENETTQCLIVREYKNMSEDKKPRTVTVAHYYLDNGVGVGLSVAVKRIRVLRNGNFDFIVDGPEQHPVDALAYMFKEVVRTKTWKPTDCPHCAKRYINERQSESESDIENVPAPPRLHGARHLQNGRSIVSNPGWFKGKDIGNTYIKYFYGRKT